MHSQEGKLAEMKGSHERQLARLKGSHERALVAVEEELHGQVEEAERQVEQLEDQLEFSQLQCDKLRHKQFLQDELGQKATGETDRLSRRIAELVAQHEAELRALADRHDLQTQQLQEAHEEGVASLKRDHGKQQEEKEHEMNGLAARHQESVEDLEAYHKGQQYELNIWHEEEAAELHRQLDEVNSRREEEAAELRRQLDEANSRREEEDAGVRQQLDEVNSQREEEVAGLRQQLQDIIAERDMVIAQQSRLQQAHDMELETLTSGHNQQLSVARDELHSAQNCLRAQIDSLNEELQQEQALKAVLRIKLQDLQRHEDKLMAQHSNQVQALHKKFAVKRAQAVSEPVKVCDSKCVFAHYIELHSATISSLL